MSKILIIGGTGNMGRPLVKSLAEGGHNVSVVCRRKVGEEDIRRLASNGGGYYFGDAKDRKFMASVLTQHYDAIVDFCIYSSDEFRERMGTFLDMTDQYVCLSSAAVYADIPTPKNESSPRYMEVDPPQKGTAKWNWYCYEKARMEDLLFNSCKRNWTIVRPGITMNANHVGWGLWWNDDWLGRIIRGRRVVVERDILDFRFSLSSGAQVASLIGSVIGNAKAFGEVFNVCSSEVWTWKELLEAFRSVFSKHELELKVAYVNSRDVLRTNPGTEYVYSRARLLDRVFDNAKIRSITPLKPTGESMSELLAEWTESYIGNYGTRKLSEGQLGRTIASDRLTGDLSQRHDFDSSRLYVKYLLMRYCPSLLALYSRISGMARPTMQHIVGN